MAVAMAKRADRKWLAAFRSKAAIGRWSAAGTDTDANRGRIASGGKGGGAVL